MSDLSNHEALSKTTITLKNEERQPCEVWTRVMGYHRPVSSFNVGKKGEFHERQYFTERAAHIAQ
jgi:anaerobic ribonucleoside-triphosphate reductase